MHPDLVDDGRWLLLDVSVCAGGPAAFSRANRLSLDTFDHIQYFFKNDLWQAGVLT